MILLGGYDPANWYISYQNDGSSRACFFKQSTDGFDPSGGYCSETGCSRACHLSAGSWHLAPFGTWPTCDYGNNANQQLAFFKL